MTTVALMTNSVELHSLVSISHVVLDYLGTLAFAMSAALVAVEKKFDIVGLAVLAMVTAIGGGVIRDLIIGQHPPAAFTSFSHIGIALAAAGLVFLWQPPARLTGWPLQITDALGLAVFCVTGTTIAAHSGLSAPSAALLGALTAIGGGVIRDLLSGETPILLRPDSELYAIPAMLGSSITAFLIHFGIYSDLTGMAAALGAFGLRMLAIRFHWHAPQARRR
ncbi:membrane protein [[Mycobacterium] chelonae subsp. bovistauri]|nr:membrane protein [Mycobacterium sp. QIA-37]